MSKMKQNYAYIVVSVLVLVCFLLIGLCINYAATAFSENKPLERSRCFIIDAGHGGVDGGATSCSGVLESQFNLEIAMRLNDLMHLLGHHTIMIRTDDRSVYTKGESVAEKKVSDLKNRVEIINNTQNAILISIHQNYFPDSKYHGAQVFYAPDDESKRLACYMQTAFHDKLDLSNNRQAKRADNIYLMQHISRPGILIECGFLSNPEEEYRLRTPEYQKRLCCVIATNITGFYMSKQDLT